MTCVSANEAGDRAWRSPPAVVKLPVNVAVVASGLVQGTGRGDDAAMLPE